MTECAADDAPAQAHARHDLLGMVSRGAVFLLLVAAPLAFGAVHYAVHSAFLGLAALAGLASLARARACARSGRPLPPVPGWRVLLAFNLLVLLQATPLPPALVRVLSPTSFEYYQTVFRLAASDWRPISANVSLTRKGLLFLGALSLLYGAVFREFHGERRARRLAMTIVSVASLATLVGLVQRVSPDPNLIYGVWKPTFILHHAMVFGPYVNRSHYAGYVVMAIPLALGLAVEALFRTQRLWSRRARGFTALGEPEGSALVLWTMLVLFNVAGVLIAGSRTGVVACGAGAAAVLLALGRRVAGPALVVSAVAAIGLALVDIEWYRANLSLARLESDRVVVWRDMLRMLPDFPLLGVGWNALGDAYSWRYQTVNKWGRWNEAHNEFLQVLLVTGILGAGLAACLGWLLLRAGLSAAARGPFGIGLFGALAASAASNLADFNLQIPANAATFVAIAGLLMAYRRVPAD